MPIVGRGSISARLVRSNASALSNRAIALQLRRLDQRFAVVHVALGIVAKQYRFRALGAGADGVQHVAAATCGDVDDSHRLAARTQAPHCFPQQVLEMAFSLADAAPADRFEVDAIDQPADRRAPARFVPVDVVERAPRIETGLVAEANALRQEPAELESRARRAPVEAARGKRGQRKRQCVGLDPGESATVRHREVGSRGHGVEELQQESPHAGQRLRAILLAQRVVKESGQDVLFLVRGAEPVEEGVLRRVIDHPVRARDEKLRGQGDRRGVRHDPFRSLVEPEQHVDGDRARKQRIGIVGSDARRIVGEELAP